MVTFSKSSSVTPENLRGKRNAFLNSSFRFKSWKEITIKVSAQLESRRQTADGRIFLKINRKKEVHLSLCYINGQNQRQGRETESQTHRVL